MAVDLPTPTFPNFTQVPRRLTVHQWRWIRGSVLFGGFTLIALLFLAPDLGLTLFWAVAVPVLPVLFLVAPGVWRNLCPLAAANQTPRLFGFTRALTAPDWLVKNGYLIGVGLFVVLVATRKVLFNDNGPALAVLLLVMLAAAFTGGVFFKGKAGWCSTMCPLLPVQRLYGQTAFVASPNSHCEPCVGCAKNCFDFNPHVAYLADQYDDDHTFRTRRRFFAGVFPGLVLGYFLVPNPPEVSVPQMYALVAGSMLVSLGVFYALDALLRTPPGAIPAGFGALAFTLFYAFSIPETLDRLDLVTPGGGPWLFGAAVVPLSGFWLVRTWRKERRFVDVASERTAVRVGTGHARAASRAVSGAGTEVTFVVDDAGGEHRIVAALDKTLLELAEKAGLPLEAGCRMGVCGADPVAVVDGMGNLSATTSDEAGTISRLGYAGNTRMACQARVQGACVVRLTPEKGAEKGPETPSFPVDTGVQRVVILGNGIAGVTVADHVRRLNPVCEIHLVGKEPHHLYNRMAISRLIYGRGAMSGLYLLPDAWYDEHEVSPWLNTFATRIDLTSRTVVLGTGEELAWDRLVLATGSSSRRLSLPGIDLRGVFVLREAADAMDIRAWAQQTTARDAIVAGGGVLGIEAAYALAKLGLRVTVLERAEWPLRRQLDAAAGQLLRTYLRGLGIETVTEVELSEAAGAGHIESVRLVGGQELPCGLLLVAAGIVPNTGLAQAAGLEVRGGVVVDDQMRTSDPDVLAAGDVAECDGRVAGLWPAAVKQAEVAARNALGDRSVYTPAPPVVMLKVVGVDLTSMGRVEPALGDSAIVLEDAGEVRYRKLVLDAEGRLVGAILFGHPEFAPAVSDAIARGAFVGDLVDSLTLGEWGVLATAPTP